MKTVNSQISDNKQDDYSCAPVMGQDDQEKMFVVDICHDETRRCPNPFIKPLEWKAAIEEWAESNDISRQLREMVKRKKVLLHNIFHVSISCCPNCCSRPQIADFGLVGSIIPIFEPTDCKKCGSCSEICPDGAINYDGGLPWFNMDTCNGCNKCMLACPKKCISLSDPEIKVMAGGKLGRVAHLADVIGEVKKPNEAVTILSKIMDEYLKEGLPNERFANYWAREGKEKYNG
jgi:anaerobic sulfite reductase subunit C